jgi:hypothetical protein
MLGPFLRDDRVRILEENGAPAVEVEGDADGSEGGNREDCHGGNEKQIVVCRFKP